MSEVDVFEPQFVTLLADSDGWVRYKLRLCNYDTNYKPVDILIMLHNDQAELATRPTTGGTWSPPMELRRA